MHMLDVGCGVGGPVHATCHPLLELLKSRFICSDTTYHPLRLVETLAARMPLFRTPRLSAPRWDSFTIVRHLKDFPRYCTATPPPLMQLKAVLLGPAHHHRRHCAVCPVRTSVHGPPHFAKGSGSVYSLIVLGAGEPWVPTAPLALLTLALLLVHFALPFIFRGIGAEIACHQWMLQTYGPNLGTRQAASPPPTTDPPPPDPSHEVGMGMRRQSARGRPDAASQAVSAAGCVLMSSRDATRASGQRLLDFRGRSQLENSWLAPLDILQDGHSKFSSMKAVLNEFFELYFPCALSTNPQSRILEVRGFTGARMGCALRIDYCFLRAGEILLHDNRWLSSSAVKGQEEGASECGTLVEMWCEEERDWNVPLRCMQGHIKTEKNLASSMSAMPWAQNTYTSGWNWYCSMKKAFTRYAKKHLEDNDPGSPKRRRGDPGDSLPNKVEFAQGLFENFIEVGSVFEQDKCINGVNHQWETKKLLRKALASVEDGYCYCTELSKKIHCISSGIDDANTLTESDIPKKRLPPLRAPSPVQKCVITIRKSLMVHTLCNDLEKAQLKFIDTSSKLMLRTFEEEMDFLGVLKVKSQ
ncbi:hypothetical protein K438DRAFT_1764458 [Mycena galopus ATCC 62051]|nr:hypothetical protein K438DRAFT_1764458 [Mycena galopus ATCC 62051]